MASTTTVLYRGAAATTSTTLYTVPALTTAVATNILVSNTSASQQTFTISFNGVVAYSAITLAANSTYSLDLKQTLTTGTVIAGFASATSVNFHISGVQIV